MNRTLILIGLLLVAAGALWPWLGKLPLGHLPGDILIRRGHTTFYFPLTSMLLISAVLTLLLWILRR
ncbi:DUF2905 domain-containing protein [Halomonas koreensis]|uniref:DUF2905 domain-containing protein n=1 Tax=Halomonas koreensis TaxID=245385 RepID=A0ABU1G4N6_9GAMM|nr:DUF2905 domain-containing protein [Halomonas koreensis]MDR5867907.1 DUF2905 domain-containing protein [Halomonas koreensis]